MGALSQACVLRDIAARNIDLSDFFLTRHLFERQNELVVSHQDPANSKGYRRHGAMSSKTDDDLVNAAFKKLKIHTNAKTHTCRRACVRMAEEWQSTVDNLPRCRGLSWRSIQAPFA